MTTPDERWNDFIKVCIRRKLTSKGVAPTETNVRIIFNETRLGPGWDLERIIENNIHLMEFEEENGN